MTTRGKSKQGNGLRDYIIRRMMLMVPTFLGTTLVVFLLCQMVPGGPVDQMRLRMMSGSVGGEASTGGTRNTATNTPISEADLKSLNDYYGFSDPIHVRYFKYMKKLVTLDFGTSFRYTVPAIKLIRDRLPISLYYGIVTTILTYGICVPLGMVKAIRNRGILDNLTSVITYVGYAIPSYALGVVLVSLLSVKHDIFPLSGFVGENFEKLSSWGKVKDLVWHSALPLVCYMVGSFAVLTLLMKNSLLENLNADYVRTVLAMGGTARRAIFVHAFRNSLIPMATSFGNNISVILAGSLLIERVFNIPGMGLLFFESIQARDYPVVMALTVISTVLLLVGNLLSDLCVASVDPRVRFE
ncbi:ABC transporter permease [Candidatus Sumerlaeota bacterium]|nr:ABC transporter permease [Candidatus Sumerlaeota bacterium]